MKYKFLVLFLGWISAVGYAQQLPTIEIVNNKFVSNGEPWFSLVANYQVGIYTDNEEDWWVGPNHGYRSDNQRCCSNQLDARMALFADFARIKEMGFNTIRICGMELFATSSSLDKKLWLRGKKGTELADVQILSSKRNNKLFAQMAKIAVEEAIDAGLQVIFLTGGANIQRINIRDKYNDWLALLCDSLKKNQSVFAIDLYNEPIYTNSSNLGKIEMNKVTKMWNSTIKKRMPKTLITIGLIGLEDVISFDSEALAVDFVNYHLYPTPTDFEFVAATLYWISQTHKKPWIVGETSYSGSNDSLHVKRFGTETDQKNYAQFSLNRSFARGAQGYGWWCYRDVFWGTPEDNMGLIDQQGKEKEVVSVFKTFNILQNSKDCPIPDDLHYYRMEYSDYVVVGSVENKLGKPIANAVICGWDSDWKNSRLTVTDKNGKFRLSSKVPMKFVKISALAHNVVNKTIVDTQSEVVLKATVLKLWQDSK